MSLSERLEGLSLLLTTRWYVVEDDVVAVLASDLAFGFNPMRRVSAVWAMQHGKTLSRADAIQILLGAGAPGESDSRLRPARKAKTPR